MDEIIEFESASQWDDWLAKNHPKSSGIWIRLFKKASGVSSVSISDAVDVALCYGWITGRSRPYDEKSWLDRFVPRRPRSIWSKINTKRAEMLIKQGRMKPAGLKQVEESKETVGGTEPKAHQALQNCPRTGLHQSTPEE
jgi:uncharacterized protein YdeI (YjbR/CyaY-like superfamily)